jgi:hypothetical protein
MLTKEPPMVQSRWRAWLTGFDRCAKLDGEAARARALIEKWARSGILLLVTHGFNIQALTGISPASGEIVVVRNGGSERVGRLTLD